MKDLKHLYNFEKLLQDANNELVQKAKADGGKRIETVAFLVTQTQDIQGLHILQNGIGSHFRLGFIFFLCIGIFHLGFFAGEERGDVKMGNIGTAAQQAKSQVMLPGSGF